MFEELARGVATKACRELMVRGYFRKWWYPRYQFQYFPRQLCFLANCIDRTSKVDGAILEIGCGHGLTTTFLYEYMIDSAIAKDYFCVDTFSGFTSANISIERSRGKSHKYESMFKENNVEWFRESLRQRHITDIKVIEGDICTLDPGLLPHSVAFCLLDVDLYQPVKIGLERVYPRLSPGGMVVVDDCWSKPTHLWVNGVSDACDGAMQAYLEFASEHGLPEKFVETKLAIVERE